MERLAVYYFAVLLALTVCLAYSAEVADGKKKEEESTLWFGPRLGRKKRNPPNACPSSEDEQKLREVASFLDEYPWALLSVNGDGKRTLSFTPRLGRTLEDNFVPRLGRNVEENFVPRLGRNSEDDMFDERAVGRHSFSPRLGRMVF